MLAGAAPLTHTDISFPSGSFKALAHWALETQDHRRNAKEDGHYPPDLHSDQITHQCDREGSELTQPHLSWALFTHYGQES